MLCIIIGIHTVCYVTHGFLVQAVWFGPEHNVVDCTNKLQILLFSQVDYITASQAEKKLLNDILLRLNLHTFIACFITDWQYETFRMYSDLGMLALYRQQYMQCQCCFANHNVADSVSDFVFFFTFSQVFTNILILVQL